uniref:Uncharacterized protein n=1 Tax=Ciona savignyi TaxID=51511 RepID=H2Z2U5_CIOSA
MFKRYINNIYFLVSVAIFKYECCNGLDELGTCGAADEACGRNGDTDYFRSTNWEPFVYDSNLKWAEFASIFKQYVVWHNATYYNTAIPCKEKKVVVFTPNAGLGDSLGALSSAMAHTFRTGRLFFIDWKPYNWTVGLKALPFQYDYTIAKSRMINGKRLICPDTDPSSLLSGHITSQHPLINEETVNDLNFGYDGMMREIVQPSTKVQQIVDSVISPVVQHQHNTRLV